MLNAQEQAAKSEMVPVVINGESAMWDLWTVTTLKAIAYDQGKTVQQVLSEGLTETLNDPVKMERLKAHIEAGEKQTAH